MIPVGAVAEQLGLERLDRGSKGKSGGQAAGL
jgi:hypothetical protein